ncbi:Nectin-3-like protein [Anabarilius grahami]|uniref:Nectin-3-like protein n=1 Tax=Anabarilius grahami TaxID=495550 RepID=A0A3N0YDF6_ANAGA|nr:Nectin-3-like protein [Anabarilius grahami]
MAEKMMLDEELEYNSGRHGMVTQEGLITDSVATCTRSRQVEASEHPQPRRTAPRSATRRKHTPVAGYWSGHGKADKCNIAPASRRSDTEKLVGGGVEADLGSKDQHAGCGEIIKTKMAKAEHVGQKVPRVVHAGQKVSRAERVGQMVYRVEQAGQNVSWVEQAGQKVSRAEHVGPFEVYRVEYAGQKVSRVVHAGQKVLRATSPVNVSVTVDAVPVAGHSEVTLATCTASTAEPAAEVSWQLGTFSDSVRISTSTVKHQNETFTVKSSLIATPTVQMNQQLVKCVIRHATMKEELRIDHKITVHYPPQLVFVTPFKNLSNAQVYQCEADANPAATHFSWHR